MVNDELKTRIAKALDFFSEETLHDLYSYLNHFVKQDRIRTSKISIFDIPKLMMPLPELIDRMTISELKVERIGDNECLQEYSNYDYIYEFYKELGFSISQEKYKELKTIHSKIWDLESDLRKGKEKIFTIDEIANRTFQIRDLNKERVNLKNTIASNHNFPLEIKKDHASE